MRIATVLMLTPSYTNAVAGASTLNVAGGISGFAAALAPELALAGFEAQPDAIEEALGNLVGDGFAPDHLTDEVGETWHITHNYFRLYACCNPIHPALDCLAAALAELRPNPDQIERIEVATYRFASVMRNPEPANYFASKYSLPHAAAVMAVRGNAGFLALDDSALRDPTIAALRRRVQIGEDSAMSAKAPRLRPARVTVTLTDGRHSTQSRDSHRGDFQEPFTETEIRAKFRELAEIVLTPESAGEVERAVDRCEEWPDIGELTRLLRQHEV
jgi:2-methylcitrate dehydratase PrpD